MNEKFTKFIDEEINKLHKITLLKEEKQQIEEKLQIIQETEKIPQKPLPNGTKNK